MNNQTVNNDENNRGRKTKKELEIALRSVWQGLVESNSRSEPYGPQRHTSA